MTNSTPNQLAVRQEPHDTGLGRMLEAAIALGTEGKDVLVEIVAMRRQEEDRQALRDFAAAMAMVQSEIPAIVKDRRNQQTSSSYATYSTVARALRPVYTRHGFSLLFGTGEATRDGDIRILCDIMHAGGHLVKRHLDLPPDDRGIKGNINKTQIHATASAVSYGQRYLTCMIFAPEITDEDRDGNPPPRQEERHVAREPQRPPEPNTISEAQRRRMWGIAKGVGVSQDTVRDIVASHGYESTADIPRREYDSIVTAIQNRASAEERATARLLEEAELLDEAGLLEEAEQATAGEDAPPVDPLGQPIDEDTPF